jgi:hypothetical protein
VWNGPAAEGLAGEFGSGPRGIRVNALCRTRSGPGVHRTAGHGRPQCGLGPARPYRPRRGDVVRTPAIDVTLALRPASQAAASATTRLDGISVT